MDRYARQTVLPEIGDAGQAALSQARILVIGAGGLGAPVLLYLAAAGVATSGKGCMGIIDADHVSLTNLQRQILFEEADIGRLKVEAARDRLQELNSTCTIKTYASPFTLEHTNIIQDHDIVLDCTDNFTTRYAINTACLQHNTPWIMAALGRWQGYLSLFTGTQGSPCYQCFHPVADTADIDRTTSCEAQGVIGPFAGMMGTLQAIEAIKHITGAGDSLAGKLLQVDTLSMQMRHSTIVRDPKCMVCRTI